MSDTTAWPCCYILQGSLKAPTDHPVILCRTAERDRFDMRYWRVLLHKRRCLLALQRCTFSGRFHAVFL